MFADVAFPISSFQTFTYKIPEELKSQLSVGVRVRTPFRNRLVQGIVVGLRRKSDFSGKILSIKSLVDDQPVLDTYLWKLIQWVSEYYYTPLGQVARTALPSNLSTRYQPPVRLLVKTTGISLDISNFKKRAPVQAAVLKHLEKQSDFISVADLKPLASNPTGLCKKMAEKGWVEVKEVLLLPDATGFTFEPIHKKIRLTKYQESAIKSIGKVLEEKAFSPFLVHGVTGSGKTEIYIEAANHTLKEGRTVIMLLPEIALTPQIAGRFRAVFGDTVALWHSKLNPAARAWTWKRICSGDFKVVIGARSAIFAPLKNLGLIVVDEEQEHSYKQESPGPRYHARDVALMRGKLHKAAVVLASATPSMESYYNQLQEKFKYIHLPKRYGGAKYPHVHVVDMLKESEETEKYGQVFSRLLIDKIERRLSDREQIILLQNRRGYAPILRCNDCGEIEMCPSCQVALTFHRVGRFLRCHFCGHTQKALSNQCSSCYSSNLKLAGTGTQRVEEILKEKFPNATVDRLDVDTAKSGTNIKNTLQRFSDHKTDILLGTQMIAKGLDFANATLVGIINGDTGLYLPDFRSGEKVFQLIYQAAGRAGRGKKPGEVIVQTYNKDNSVIKCATQLDLKKYYNIALNERNELQYPPFSWIAKVELSSLYRDSLEKTATKIRGHMNHPFKGLGILGPAYCYRERLRNRYRMQVVLKSSKTVDQNGTRLHHFLSKRLIKNPALNIPNSVRMHIDINPVSLL